MNKKLIYAFVLIVPALMFSVITTFALTKNYNGVTTVTYNNLITTGAAGASGWNGGFKDSTSPSRSMDQLGATVITTYQTCNGAIDYSTWVSANNIIYTNVTKAADQVVSIKKSCPPNQTRRLVDYVQHFWQDYPYGGDGATVTTSVIQNY